MNVSTRTVISASAIFSVICIYDFATRVYIQTEIKEYQKDKILVPKVLKSAGVPEDLSSVLAEYKSGNKHDNKESNTAAGETGFLANFKFSLIAIYQKAGQYTALLTVEASKDQPARMIKMSKETVYSEVSVQQIDQKFVVLAYQQQTIRLRLFEKSGSK